ncbi:MAG: S41 family peptidase [Deinococcales bacterium]
MKKSVLALFAAFALSGLAEAQKYTGTPAQDLFDQASFYLDFHYNGFSGANLERLVEKYQAQIDDACAPQAQTCPFDVARRPIAAMIEELQDPHSYFVPADVARQFAGQLGGGGSGAPSLELSSAKLRGVSDRVVTDVRADGPAGKAGLLRGDRIIAINGQALPSSRSNNDNLIPSLEQRGQAINFSVLRKQARLEIAVTPVVVQTPWLPESKSPTGLPSGTALIRIHEFTPFKDVGQKFHELVNTAQQAGASSIVVDLRDNPGGVATECTSAPGAFMPEVVNTLERRHSKTVFRYQNGIVSTGDGQKMSEAYIIAKPAKFTGKVAVLVNAESASCGEVFPAQIQAAKRGLVVGEPTYGILNTATSFFDLADGSLLGLTIAKSLHPNGQYFPERVKPDLEVSEDLEALANGRDVMLEKALEGLNNTTTLSLPTSLPTLPRELYALGGL